MIDLVNQRALAETNAIRARADISKTQADVRRAEAELERARQNLGAAGYGNPKVQQAMVAIQQARLNLTTPPSSRRRWRRHQPPFVGRQYVNQGQPLLSFIQHGPRWISAAMREKPARQPQAGDKVLVALDDNPGKLSPGAWIASVGCHRGDEAPTGQLPDVQAAKGWLREPQRFPVRIMLTPTTTISATGLRAKRSPSECHGVHRRRSILNPIGRLWMRIIATLSYLQ